MRIEAVDTPRQTCRLVRKATGASIKQAKRKGIDPKVRKAERQAAEREAKAPPAERPESNRTIGARPARIHNAYLAHAAELMTGDADDYSISDLSDMFKVSRPTIYRTLAGQRPCG